MRTSFGICNSKLRYATRKDALCVAEEASIRLHAYRCDLCRQYHLTSRTKGMFAGRKCDKAAR
jgi:hypothetical protein